MQNPAVYRQFFKLLHTKEFFKISSNAKLVYILFIERLSLSKKNKLCNKKEEIYIVYSQKKLCKILNKTDKTIKKAIDELIENKLIYKLYANSQWKNNE